MRWLSGKLEHRLGLWLARLLAKTEPLVLAETNRRLLDKLGYCGAGVHLNGHVTISVPENVKIHDNVHIGDDSFLNGRGGITIGENTHISRNFVVFSANHTYQGSCLPYDETHDLKPVTIGRNVWIGTNVVLVPGVEIGDGAIIGAGTVVTKKIPPLAIVGGQSPRIIKYRDKEHYERLDAKRVYGGVAGKLLKA